MSHSDAFIPFDPAGLPPVIVRYLSAQDDKRNRASVAETFAAHARVTDEGIRYDGADAIRGWLMTAATEYTYTTTFTGQQNTDVGHWVVRARLEGDFPGGVADLRFRFTVEDDAISELVIAP